MFHFIVSTLDTFFSFKIASAHGDIPCKIYDPITAQINTLTVIRLQDLIAELGNKESLTLSDQAQLSRLVAQKELHTNIVKEEVRIIWGDYFKTLQCKQVAAVNELVHQIMRQGSTCKQSIDVEHGQHLLDSVNAFAEAFWLTKGMKTFKGLCPYPPSKKLVYPKLNPLR